MFLQGLNLRNWWWGSGAGDEAPIGTITALAHNTIPNKWMECTGGLLPIAGVYSQLFGAIQHNWASGQIPPLGYFYIPNLQNRYLRGIGAHGSTTDDKGYGTQVSLGNFQNSNLVSHKHGNDLTGGGTAHDYPTENPTRSSASQNGTSTSTPDPDPGETRPKSYGIRWIIKVV